MKERSATQVWFLDFFSEWGGVSKGRGYAQIHGYISAASGGERMMHSI